MRSPAFTLIEILVVIGIVAIVTSLGFFSFNKAKVNQGVKASAEQFSDTLKRAHIFAREAKDGKDWGVENTSLTSYSLYSGDMGDPDTWVSDTTKELEKGTEFQNDFLPIWFAAGTGETTTNQQITLENTNNIQISVNVSATGVVEVQPL